MEAVMETAAALLSPLE